MGTLPLEQVDDLATDRIQRNVQRKFEQDSRSDGGFNGCLGGAQENLGNNSFKVPHSLGRPPKGFVITAQATSGSLKATMANPTGTDVTITWSAAPGTFSIFLY